MATACLQHSSSHPVTWSHCVQSNPDVPRCAWLHVVIPSSMAWEAQIPQFWSGLRGKKKKGSRGKGAFLFSLNSVAFWNSSVALGYFRAFPTQLFPNTESASHNVVLRKRRKPSSDIFISSKKSEPACSFFQWKTLRCKLRGFSPSPAC